MRIHELIIESDKLLKNGDFQGAIQKLNHALILNPEKKEIKELLMGLYIQNDETENAFSTVNQLLELGPDNTEYLFVKANCLSDLNQLGEALEIYNNIITIDPLCFKAYGGRGVVFYKLSQLDNALTDFNKAIENPIKNAIIFAYRGLVFIDKQKFKQALKDFDKALKIDRNLEIARINRAFVLRTLGKFDEAFKEIGKTEHIGINSEGHHQKGIIYLKNNRLKEALDSYNKAVELDKNNVEALYSRAMLYAQMNDFENSFKDLDLSMQLENAHFKDYLLNGYADAYRKTKEYDKAISFAKSAISYNGDFFYGYITLAEIYGEIGDDENFYKNLQLGLESGFNIEDIDESIKKKYFKNKEFKNFLKNVKPQKPNA